MSELSSTETIILLVTNGLLAAGTVSLTLSRLRTASALTTPRDPVVVACAGAGILLLLAVLLVPWASAPGDAGDGFTRAPGSSGLGASATIGSMAALALIARLGWRRRSLPAVGAVAFGLSSLWLAVGLSSLVVVEKDTRPGPGIWLAMTAALPVAVAGARATSGQLVARPSAPILHEHRRSDHWDTTPPASTPNINTGDDW